MWFFAHRSFINGIALAGLTLASSPAVAQEQLSVPVQVLSPATASNVMAMQRPPVSDLPQVTPAARMPQYQLHRMDLGTVAHPESPSIRFLLVLPERPLLVEALVTIDGQPFAQQREQRIQKIMTFINDPESLRQNEAKPTPAAVVEPESIPPPPEVATELIETPAASSAETTPGKKPEETAVDTVAKYHPPSTIEERVQRSMIATGTKPSAPEIRWMLANLTDGPVLLFLNDNFQRTRAEQQPMFFVLDTNRDQVVSAEEIASAVQSLEACDLDRNDVVESTEIAKVAKDPRNWGVATRASHPLVVRLDQATFDSTLIPRLRGYYGDADSSGATGAIDTNRDGKLDGAERKSLLERPADLVLRFDLHTPDPAVSRLSVVSGSDIVKPAIKTAVCSTHSMLLTFPHYALELSAVQGAASDQISIGAVNDGYAMLPELDPNGDGRFTIRERRTLVDRLKTFDRDGDSSIAVDEIFPTYRLCLALGSNAHEPLSLLRRSNSTAVSDSAAPDWFTQMDKNQDHDLARQEFPGTDEQFRQLDLDSDQLISPSEADQAQN